MVDIAAAVLEPIPIAEPGATIDPFVVTTVYEILGDKAALVPAVTSLQRIYDTSLGSYVYFTRASVDPTAPPIATTDTQPNNSGSLDLTTHAVLSGG